MTEAVTDAILRARAQWRFRGDKRPDFAREPAAGQESVWDYPRPPRLDEDGRLVQVFLRDTGIAESRDTIRVLETASPPVLYIPPTDVRTEHLFEGTRESFCEWKGRAKFWSVRLGDYVLENVGWSYPEPLPGFEPIAGYLSFFPARLACTIDGERVEPQPGDFYGGWVTSEIVGPFKGAPGTEWW